MIALRIFLLIYCVSLKLARCAYLTLVLFLLPLMLAMSIVGTIFYAKMRSKEPTCVSEQYTIRPLWYLPIS